ncbi:ABC transporter permease [Fulvivirga sp. 29W222]|uniref:ABC transporter permease n=1 Tax=Fulvivirga marina TaxID=2494733 RepID=A0A937KCT2_9BACT|nr:ABC transporter permease [Fulvivirga marina]MBL6447857.1 ABC transporter permease [Fulvivirga marina]
MLKNLFKIAIRNILKEKGYSIINILGLAIGIMCSMFLGLYIMDELSYDRYHDNADNIYRVVSNIKEPDNSFTWAIAQIPMADELRDNYPDVVNAVRFFGLGRNLYKYEDKSFYEEDIFLADSTVFEMFSYQFIAGDSETALDEPYSIVVTESMAIKYFGTIDCLNLLLTDQDNDQLKVTGVIKGVPANSHFRFDALISRNSEPDYQGSWGNFGVFTYIQLPGSYQPANFKGSLDKVVKDHVDPIFEQFKISINYELQRITDIHLYSKIQDEAEEGGDISYIYIFAAVAVFMLVIASINYMNLATARSTQRAKEVGVRKVMGAGKGQLVSQFMIESLVMSFVALVMSMLLIYIFLPAFNNLANKQIEITYLFQSQVLLILVGVTFIIGIIGGSYPAFYLSRFNPVNVLKGKLSTKGGNAILRKTLVVLQFSISIFMLISTLVVFDQLKFLMNKDLGFDKEQVLRFEMPDDQMQAGYNGFRQKLLTNPNIINVASSSSTPGNNVNKVIFNVETEEGEMNERGIDFFVADFDFIEAMQMSIVEGRNFSRDILSDTSLAVLVNESMVDRMGWTEPLGKKFDIPQRGGEVVTKKVVGVVKDYHQNSLYDEIEPLMIMYGEGNYYGYVKLQTSNISKTVNEIEAIWGQTFINKPFEYNFLDQDFASQYTSDKRRGDIFTIFSSLTIAIACLGLLGLTAYTTERRTKEIGIRKVIGASVKSIVALLSKEFVVLVLIATVIAFPIAWYFMDTWLQAFAYRIELRKEVPTFVLSAGIALLIIVFTMSYHTIRAAISNPVNALKDE